MNEEFEKWAEKFAWFGRDGKTEALEIWEAAWQASRKQALEEAAKVCDEQDSEPECPERAAYCAEAIRALQKT